MMGFGMIGGVLLFWVVLIILAVFLVSGLFQTSRSGEENVSPSARRIVEQRYARGEINREQYQLMLKDLD